MKKYTLDTFGGIFNLKGLSHQFESGYKWYGWKEQKIGEEPLSIFTIFHSFFDF
jgi:hypothetical protein